MGYDYTYDGQVNIDKEDIPKAIRAITDEDPEGPDFRSELSSLFMDVGYLSDAPDFRTWFVGDTPVVTFAMYGATRSPEKLEQFLANIAPHVRGVWIECKGEDGYLWGYSIENGEVKVLSGQVIYS